MKRGTNWNVLPGCFASTSMTAANSASSARRLGTSRLSRSVSMNVVENPSAPAVSARSSTAAMRARSSAVAARSHASGPITNVRSAWCPTNAPTLMAAGFAMAAARYSGQSSHDHGSACSNAASGRSSMKQNSSTIDGRIAADNGATVSPQLPMIAVVVP